MYGTEEFKLASAAYRDILDASNCHTLDREDMRAQRDVCGIGTSNDQWRYAVEKMFNMTHWAYVQTDTIRSCAENIFYDSYTNLIKDEGLLIQTIGISLVAMQVGLLLLI